MHSFNPYFVDRYDSERKYADKKEEYYSMKEELLSIVQPTCIHRESRKEKVRYYDYESRYGQVVSSGECIHSGEYYDREQCSYVSFVDVYEDADPQYYLFYDLGTEHTFHKPIRTPDGYNLDIKDIDILDTYGAKINDLISVQFVKKVIDIIRSGHYVMV